MAIGKLRMGEKIILSGLCDSPLKDHLKIRRREMKLNIKDIQTLDAGTDVVIDDSTAGDIARR